jgi:hypothetical protein
MVKPKTKERTLARELRQQGWGIKQIAAELAVSVGSVSKWVRDVELTAAQQAALQSHKVHTGAQAKGATANRDKWLQKRQEAQHIGRLVAQKGSRLHLMGCMLYWAEGAKNRNNINFVNSDVVMMQLFMRFLREELHVSDEDVALHIHCHDESQIVHVEQFWPQILGLPSSCLRKTIVKKGSTTRRNRLPNGICSLRVYSTDLVMQIYGAIQEYGGFDNPEWLF